MRCPPSTTRSGSRRWRAGSATMTLGLILDHLAAGPPGLEVVHADEAHSAQPGNRHEPLSHEPRAAGCVRGGFNVYRCRRRTLLSMIGAMRERPVRRKRGGQRLKGATD
jgi:hypothetical protein